MQLNIWNYIIKLRNRKGAKVILALRCPLPFNFNYQEKTVFSGIVSLQFKSWTSKPWVY